MPTNQSKLFLMGLCKEAEEYPLESIYDAIAFAETGGEKNPFIRTRLRNTPGGSTAYGPLQITSRLAEGYHSRPQYRSMFTPDERNYLQRYIHQGRTMAAFGNNPKHQHYDPRYDYGGSGHLDTPEDRAMYRQVGLKMLQEHIDRGGSVERALELWRGVPQKQDPRYYQKIMDRLKPRNVLASNTR